MKVLLIKNRNAADLRSILEDLPPVSEVMSIYFAEGWHIAWVRIPVEKKPAKVTPK